MKGNPQNIEVGDVVRYTSFGEPISSVVLSVCDQGYINSGAENSIDGYLVRATVMNRSTICNYPVNELTIVRKWNASVPAEQIKQKEVIQEQQNTTSYRYDEESARTSKSPIIIALTKYQKDILIDNIWKQHNDPRVLYCIEYLDMFHTDVIPKYIERPLFTHYVLALSEDNVNNWLKTISRHKWSTEDVLKWSDTYQLVFDKRSMSVRSLQYILNEVVDDYVRLHGTVVTKQETLSVEHCGGIPANE